MQGLERATTKLALSTREPLREIEFCGAPSPGLASLVHPLPHATHAGEGYKEEELLQGNATIQLPSSSHFFRSCSNRPVPSNALM